MSDLSFTGRNAALSATDSSVTSLQPSDPNIALTTYAPMIGKFVVIFAGGFLMEKGINVSAWTGEQWITIIGGLVTLGGGVMTWISNQVRAHREHQIAMASAAASAAQTMAAGAPVAVAVQPPPSKI